MDLGQNGTVPRGYVEDSTAMEKDGGGEGTTGRKRISFDQITTTFASDDNEEVVSQFVVAIG